jgi:hypothetical protein
MARHLADAADPRTRARLPERDSLIRMIRDWETGKHQPKDPCRLLYCRVFGTTEAELFSEEPESTTPGSPHFAEEIEALELARRVAASDVGTETLDRLELAVDDLAMAYQGTPPAELLKRVRRHLSYVSHLLDANKMLIEHRRLLTVGGWLSLLTSTCHGWETPPQSRTPGKCLPAWSRLRTDRFAHAEQCPHALTWHWTFSRLISLTRPASLPSRP